jgi:hypothetical protein
MAKQSTLTYVLQARIDKLEAGLNQANKKMSSFQRSTKNISSQIQGHFVAMFGVAAVIAFGKATFDLILKLDGVNRALMAVSGSTAEYQRAKLLLSITSEKYGANILDLTSAYTKFSAATKGSSLSTKELDGIFTSITKSAGVLGLSTEQTEGTFKALEQMFSKGCLGLDTPILMFDGSVKMVQNVLIGDELMGDDGTERKVLKTVTGFEAMYRVDQEVGISFDCNANHILPLLDQNGNIVKVLAKEFGGQNYKGFNNKGVQYKISVTEVSPNDYYGFEISGNRLFCLGDGTVTHNTVAAEEIRGQLSERLPGAFTILAKSMGITTEELNKQLKLGNVLADEVLPKFALEYEKAIGADQVKRVETLTSEVQRLGNSWTLAVESMAKSGGVFAKILKDLNDEITIARGLLEGKLKGKELFLDFADLADLVRKKDEEALVAATKLAAGQKAALTTIFNAYTMAGGGAEDFLETQKMMRKYNLSDALEPAQITEILGMFEALNQGMDEGLRLANQTVELTPAEIKAAEAKAEAYKKFREELEKLNMELLAMGGAAELELIGDIQGQMPNTKDLYRELDGPVFIKDDFSNLDAFFERLKPPTEEVVEEWNYFLEEFNKKQTELNESIEAQAAKMEGLQSMMAGISTDMIASLTISLVSGQNPFKALLGILGEGLIQLGKFLIIHSKVMDKIKAALADPFGTSGFAMGIIAIAAGAALKSAASGANSGMAGGGGGGGAQNRGFNGETTGQSMKVGGEFTIRGRDLVYILDQNKTKDGRAKANF